MNINYLKQIELGKTSKSGYLTKSQEIILSAFDESKRTFIRPHSAIKLSFPEEVQGYTYEDFLVDFEKMLKSKGHLSSEAIILSLTTLFLYLREKSGYTDRAWIEFTQKMFTSCRLHMEYPMLIGTHDLEVNLQLMDYNIGKFDIDTFRDTIQKQTKSDYYDRFIRGNSLNEDILRDSMSFRRIDEKITVFYLNAFTKQFMSKLTEVHNLYDLYFEALSKEYFDNFWNEFDRQLMDSVAFGGVYYNPLYFRTLGIGEGTQICIYTNIGKKTDFAENSWVLPLVSRITEFHFDSQTRIPVLNEKLRTFYDTIENQDSDFYNLIELMIKYVAKGIIELYENKNGEALLDFWIGLDTILNDDNQEARSNLLKNRVSALTWYAFKKNHSSQYFLINELYSMRSQYVHSGIEPKREKVLQLRDVAQTILEILIRMHKNNQEYEDLTLENWYLDIDNLAIAGRNNPNVENELLENLGIIEM